MLHKAICSAVPPIVRAVLLAKARAQQMLAMHSVFFQAE
jgi:hypothetical protein